MNIMDMDKKMCKDLNISPDDNSDVPKSPTTPAMKDNKQCNNEETDGSISMTSSEKQEWSVTLYDVDRKGNVSEEDLARLVTMLYKAAGSSITVPQQGSGTKKIKLRLSVAPDQNHTKVYIQKPTNTGKNNEEDNSTSQPTTTTNSNQVSSCKKDRKHKDRHKYPSTPVAAKTNPPSHSVTSPSQDAGKENIDNSRLLGRSHSHTKAYSHRKRSKKRHGRTQSADKHHSRAENKKSEEGPVMENMDRRQYYKDLVGIENETLQSLELTEEKHDNPLNVTAPASLLMNCGESQGIPLLDNDLLKCEKSQTVFLPPPTKDKSNRLNKQVHFEGGGNGYINGGFTSSHSHHHHGSKHTKSRSHGRTRPKSCPVVDDGLENDLGHSFREQFIDGLNHKETETESKTLNVFLTSPAKTAPGSSPVNNTGIHSSPSKPVRETVSPHHLRRHRNREQEYNRSMKQVAEWIQRQHAWVASPPGLEEVQGAPPVVLHHEHHHIHEHHHHYHFYHYYET